MAFILKKICLNDARGFLGHLRIGRKVRTCCNWVHEGRERGRENEALGIDMELMGWISVKGRRAMVHRYEWDLLGLGSSQR